MLGYKHGRLRWLGTAGARLDDLITWLPCRMVLITLPLVSMNWTHWPTTVRAAAVDGKPDPSPNAGLSESIFAHCSDVQMGGLNRYGNIWINKPLLSAQSDKATSSGVRKLLNLGLRLEVAWLIVAAGWSFLQ
jgi:adenosylcobinamide-phosphate synthase